MCCLLIVEIVRVIDFVYCLLIGIARTTDSEGSLLLQIVRTTYLRYKSEVSGQLIWETSILIGIVVPNNFVGSPLFEVV